MDTQKNPSIFDAEQIQEQIRLLKQDSFLTREIGGVFPSSLDLSSIHTVLDLACGTGGWVHDVAESYPSIQVIGVDIHPTMLHHAINSSMSFPNASFLIMDVTHPGFSACFIPIHSESALVVVYALLCLVTTNRELFPPLVSWGNTLSDGV